MTKKNLVHLIAQAIKAADSSYFFEDYTKQAAAVKRVLAANGYAVVPISPTHDMIQAGVDAVIVGRTHPTDLTQNIYHAMLGAAAKI